MHPVQIRTGTANAACCVLSARVCSSSTTGPRATEPEQRWDLLEIVDDREGKGSLLITSQIPNNRWHEIIGDPTLGDAILDRVIHRAHRIELQGESLRKRQALTIAEGLTNAKET